MPISKLPKANTWLQHYDNAGLGDQAQIIVNGLTASIADYPTPPVGAVALQSLVTEYTVSLAASIGGNRQQKKEFNAIKVSLEYSLRTDAAYVNQIVVGLINDMTFNYDAAAASIAGTGYQLSVDPSPAGPLTAPVIKKFGSPKIGQLHVQLISVTGAKSYVLYAGTTGTDPNTWIAYPWPNTRIRVNGLTSASTLDFRAVAIGTSPVRNFSVIKTQVII